MCKLAVAVLLGFLTVPTVRSAESNGTGCNATEVWERMVAAKGGRSVLHSIDRFFVHKRYRWRERWVTRTLDSRTLFIFPDFVWHWFDSGTRLFGTEVWIIADGVRVTERSDTNYITKEPDDVRKLGWLIGKYLLETRWLKPEPRTCTMGGGTGGPGVQLDVEFPESKYSLRFYLESDSSLPKRIDEVHRDQGEVLSRYDLQDYRVINGVSLPLRIVEVDFLKRQMTFDARYEINPPIAEGFTRRPPSFRDGPDAWRGDAGRNRKRAR